ncbi:hypothetical protein BP5796_03264 [Coleophoma crateriformis]|uniref:Autophagy-related protein 14 n=1 Tax=Coleophoma crateriformis TaxID=565419 RepID=A0A3D8SMN5_9HELO|nr:hypothetical protein BP5796_03264 [Coleophoma crateriformis]
MQCDICFRVGGHKLAFLCPTDARNQLYEPRIRHAHVLLEKDNLDRQITALTAPHSNATNSEPTAPDRPISRWDIEQTRAGAEQAVDRTQQIIEHADELRSKIEKARQEIARKKASIARRKSELASASNGSEARRARQEEEIEQSIRRNKYKWNQVHSITASSRVFLCGEAAKLYGLRRSVSRGGPEEYKIGGVTIIDLRSMNTATPAQITTALSHIVHLLMLTTHYLAIRLPAEITLPHRDYPLPTIFSLSSSYMHNNIPFPGITSAQPSSNSPSTSRHGEIPKNLPRPRPLFLHKPLPLLANEDPAGYALFLEGVTLLAYDIAWVCKSQGIPIGLEATSTLDELFAIGRNFYNLLLTNPSRSGPPTRTPSSQATPPRGGTREPESETEDSKKVPGTIMGRYSHGTAHSYLGSAEGNEFIRSWKLPSPIKLADRLKAKLLSEVANAEWEFLDQNAWTLEDELGDDGVVVGARKEGNPRGMAGMQSFMSMRTVMDAVEVIGGEDRKPGTSGWTKLKPRQ